MRSFDPAGVIIDGAVPRTPWERCYTLLAYAEAIAGALPIDTDGQANFKQAYQDKIDTFVSSTPVEDDFPEIENDICELISSGANNMGLDREFYVWVGYPNPGDVTVRETIESITERRLKEIHHFLTTRLWVSSVEPVQPFDHVENTFQFNVVDEDDNEFCITINGPEEN